MSFEENNILKNEHEKSVKYNSVEMKLLFQLDKDKRQMKKSAQKSITSVCSKV